MMNDFTWVVLIFMILMGVMVYIIAKDRNEYVLKILREDLQKQNATLIKIHLLLYDDSVSVSNSKLLSGTSWTDGTVYYVEYLDADGKLQAKNAILDFPHVIEWKDRLPKGQKQK